MINKPLNSIQKRRLEAAFNVVDNPIFSTSGPHLWAFFMTYYVYILYSPSFDQYYVGQTDNLEDRLFRHNNSGSRSTKKTNDWELKYKEGYPTRAAAVQRENEIKKKESRKYIDRLIAG